MRVDELITELRQDFLEDDIVPYKWSDTKVLRYFNEAILEESGDRVFLALY